MNEHTKTYPVTQEHGQEVLSKAWEVLAERIESGRIADRERKGYLLAIVALGLLELDTMALSLESVTSVFRDNPDVQNLRDDFFDKLCKLSLRPVVLKLADSSIYNDLKSWITNVNEPKHFVWKCLSQARELIEEASRLRFSNETRIIKLSKKNKSAMLLWHEWQAKGAATVGTGPAKPETSPISEPVSPINQQSAGHPVDNQEKLVQLLTDATRVTLIGFPHGKLTEILQDALVRKKQVFWRKITVVNLNEKMLKNIHDELLRHHTIRDRANKVRLQNLRKGKGLLRNFLAHHPDDQWELYEYDFMLPFVGAFFEIDGKRLMRVAVLQPGKAALDHRFFDYRADNPDEREFYATCQESSDAVVKHAVKWEEQVLAGLRLQRGQGPEQTIEPGIVFQEYRFRKSIMANSRTGVWIPRVRIILWYEKENSKHLLLQTRTQQNAMSESGRLSHLGGFITPDDVQLQPTEKLEISGWLNAVNRRLGDVGITSEMIEEPVHAKFVEFHSRDTEDFYFCLFKVKFTGSLDKIQEEALLETWNLADILEMRKHRVLNVARKVVERAGSLSEREIEVLAANLTLHGEKAIADAFLKQDYKEFDNMLRSHSGTTQNGGVEGLSEFVYRELFISLLPHYSEIGVLGAQELLKNIGNIDPDKRNRDRLEAYYHSRSVLGATLPDL